MEIRSCLFCSKDFIPPSTTNIKRGGGKYCSRKCYFSNSTPWNLGKKWSLETRKKISEAQKGKRVGQDNHFFGKKHTTESKEKIRLAQLGRKRVFTMEHRKKIGNSRKGEKSNFWKGGVTDKNLAFRSSLEYKLWRTAVFERDKYTCVWCGDNRGGNLEADHIKPFSVYEELRLDTDNGRTLCKDCHKTTKTWGSKARHFIRV